jgi:transcriptional regulator with XRE-family HTH domain
MEQSRKKARRRKGLMDPTRIIGDRVAEVRDARGMTQEALAQAMRDVGIDWGRVVVAKLEKGIRPFVKVDEFLALCVVLEICPVDLLVPIDLGEYQPYRVAPTVAATAGNVREWVSGDDLLIAIPKPEPPIYKPATLLNSIRWMPADRANRVAERYFRKKEERKEEEDSN